MRYEEISAKLPLAPMGEMVLGLDSMRQLMAHFDHPENKLKTVHIAGTNGKGSTAKMVASVLQAAGYKVGLFTSPSLVDFNERIQINGTYVSDEMLMRQVNRVKENLAPGEYYTEFEIFTGLAWLIFEESQVDFVVLEVGLGGRLDATNIVANPLLTVITKIALDHQKILGSTISEIAGEKAGIIKEGIPLILYPQVEKQATATILARAKEKHAPVIQVQPTDIQLEDKQGSDLQGFYYKRHYYQIPLLAPYQVNNAVVALETIFSLKKEGVSISDQAITSGMGQVAWPARFEKISHQPDIIVDGSHNLDGILTLKEAILTYYPQSKIGKRVAIIGMLADKDVAAVVAEIAPIFTKIITVTPHSNRALDAKSLAEFIKKTGVSVQVADDDQMALALASEELAENDVLCIFGSFYFVGYLRNQIIKRQKRV